jgi:hypothetical protein
MPEMAQRPDWLPPAPRRGMSDGIKVLLIMTVLLLVVILGIILGAALR